MLLYSPISHEVSRNEHIAGQKGPSSGPEGPWGQCTDALCGIQRAIKGCSLITEQAT